MEEASDSRNWCAEYVVRAKAQLIEVLIDQLRASIKAVKTYHHKVESFFASSPAAELSKTLPGGKAELWWRRSGPNWANAAGRWQSR